LRRYGSGEKFQFLKFTISLKLLRFVLWSWWSNFYLGHLKILVLSISFLFWSSLSSWKLQWSTENNLMSVFILHRIQ
jgi:hypothetical protein